MDESPKDPIFPATETGLNPADKIVADFSSLTPEKQRELARSLFFNAYQLPPGWINWLDDQLITPTNQRLSDDDKPQAADPNPTRPDIKVEDELETQIVSSIKNVSVLSKFPNGLVINGVDITAHNKRLRREAYTAYSPDGWRYSSWLSRAGMLQGWFGNHEVINKAFPQAAFVTEEPSPNQPGETIVSFYFNVDESIRDQANRPVLSSTISLNMNTNDAKKFLADIKQRPDGADIAERVLQRILPGALDGDPDSPGLKRATTTGLFILDEPALQGFFRSPEEINQIKQAHVNKKGFQEYVMRNLPIKLFSKPVGATQT